MELSVSNTQVTIQKGNTIERFAIGHIVRTKKITKKYEYRKKSRKPSLKASVVFVLLSSVLFFVIESEGIERGSFALEFLEYSLVVLIALAVLFLMDAIFNPAYRRKRFTLYFGQFVSGDGGQYSIASHGESVVDDFLDAISNAMKNAISNTYNVNIDRSLRGENINIENLVSKDKSNITFVEGQIPPGKNES
ncbi:hypothetical protein [uncultured Rhodospira sp.]|uniref:hypothetical protein n=1 Tax=uncultured Rhodospira sp. TaxID=1936189 RepID=UPI002617E51A|nr:hypothetical protein [uncultured Rhodospira sp.]